MKAEIINSGYVKVTIEASAEGETLSHSEQYLSPYWGTLPASAATAIHGCLVGLFGHEESVRLVMDKILEKLSPSQEEDG